MSKIIFDRKILFNALNSAKACLSGTGLTILKCFRFVYNKSTNEVEITSYNTLNEMRIIIPVIESDCVDGQKFAVEGDRLVKLLKYVKDSTIIAEISDKEIIFSYSGNKMSMFSEDVESYPNIKIGNKGIGIRVSVDRLSLYKSFKKTVSFAENSEVITSLCGVGINFLCNESKIHICASDKIIFVKNEIDCIPDIEKNRCINVMPSSIMEAISFLEMFSNKNVFISISEDERIMSLFDENNKFVFNCALMAIRFVNYFPLINLVKKRFNNFIKLNISDFINSLSRIKVMCDTYYIAHFYAEKESNKINIIYSNDIGYNISEDVFISDGVCNLEINCNINIEKLIKTLKIFPDNYIYIYYDNYKNNSPICIRCEDKKDELMAIVNIFIR